MSDTAVPDVMKYSSSNEETNFWDVGDWCCTLLQRKPLYPV